MKQHLQENVKIEKMVKVIKRKHNKNKLRLIKKKALKMVGRLWKDPSRKLHEKNAKNIRTIKNVVENRHMQMLNGNKMNMSNKNESKERIKKSIKRY